MQIELIGCTSAGKSTLARGILQTCRKQGVDIILGEDFVLKQLRLNGIKSRSLRKLLVNLAGLFASLVTWRTHREFYSFATHLLFQLPIPRLERLGLLRNVLKRIGIYEIIRFRSTGQQIILVDEGTLHIAHNLFVHGSVQVETEHLSTFVKLIPLPDVVVYLRQPEPLLIDRIVQRGHKRLGGDGLRDKVVCFVSQAVAAFDQLGQYPAVKNRLLIVNGDQNVNMAVTNHSSPRADEVLKMIRSGFVADQIVSPPR